MNLIQRNDEIKLADALSRIEQLEHERVVFQAFLALAVKKRMFTTKEFENELALATAFADQQKAAQSNPETKP